MKTRQTKRLIATVLGIAASAGAAAALASAKVYVADEEANTVSVLHATSFKLLRTIAVGREPHNVQVAPDGKLVWVTTNGEVAKSSEAQAHKGMPMGEHAAMGERGEVWANGGENTVSVVDTAARLVVATVPVGAYPHGIRISPYGREAYVANLKGGTVSVIDTAARKQVAEIPAGKAPAQVGFTPDGRLAFVSLSGEGKVAIIDPARRKVIAKVPVGTVPIQLYATPDSRTLLVANQGTRKKPGNSVSVIDLEGFKLAKTIVTGPGAHGVVVDRDGRYAYVTNIYANSVSVLDLKERKVVASVPVGKGPNGISVTP